MTELTRKTVTTHSTSTLPITTEVATEVVGTSQTIEYVIDFICGIIEVLLSFRFVLKLLGASMASQFTNFIYSITNPMVWPFIGIFHRGFTQGIDGTAILEPETVMAMVVYALLAWGIIKLIQILSREPQPV